jgi:hypothetical protein
MVTRPGRPAPARAAAHPWQEGDAQAPSTIRLVAPCCPAPWPRWARPARRKRLWIRVVAGAAVEEDDGLGGHPR